MLFLTNRDVRSLLTMHDAIQVAEETFREVGLGNVRMGPRQVTEIQPHRGMMLSMSSYVGGSMDILGQKLVTIYPENPSKNNLPTVIGLVQLLDPKSGNHLAIMEAAALTAIRTGAASAVATKYLATENSDAVALFGVGVQAETQLEAINLVRDIQQVKVYAPTREHAIDFCSRMSQRLQTKLSVAANPREAIENCDIVVCATTSQSPIFDGKWLRPGMHVNGVGSHTARARELDTTSILRSKLVVDSREAALVEAGDVIIPLSERAISVKHIWAELGDIVTGRRKGRTSNREITVFKSVGLASQDISSAQRTYERAVKQQRGLGIALN